jgi:hypothetical protein
MCPFAPILYAVKYLRSLNQRMVKPAASKNIVTTATKS